MFYQVTFHIKDLEIDEDENNEYGGLAEYKDENTLVRIICGCCGSIFEPDQIKITKRYENWSDVSNTIVGEFVRE